MQPRYTRKQRTQLSKRKNRENQTKRKSNKRKNRKNQTKRKSNKSKGGRILNLMMSIEAKHQDHRDPHQEH
jgi:hypothetical protein